MSWSLPDTCFSCVHYTQAGYKQDEHAPTKDAWGMDQAPKAQRFGMCRYNKCNVFWNERKCAGYQPEPGIETHTCEPRPAALEPHQDTLI